jgi:hypothetical protein
MSVGVASCEAGQWYLLSGDNNAVAAGKVRLKNLGPFPVFVRSGQKNAYADQPVSVENAAASSVSLGVGQELDVLVPSNPADTDVVPVMTSAGNSTVTFVAWTLLEASA